MPKDPSTSRQKSLKFTESNYSRLRTVCTLRWFLSGRPCRTRLVDHDFFAAGGHRHDDGILAIRIRGHNMIVAGFGDFSGSSFRVNKFQADQVAGIKPRPNGLRLSSGGIEISKFRLVVGPLAVIRYGEDR